MNSDQAAGRPHEHHSHDGHGHDLDPDTDIMAMYTPEFWDERYGSTDMLWSGHVNPVLAAVAADLRPGTVLDVGCGEGGDAIWLASQGWRVTAVDISAVALERAAAQAAKLDTEIAERITWQRTDILTWDPAPERYDLVSAQFIHLPRPALEAVHRRLAAAVAPGGTLLVVSHHPAELETATGRQHLRELMYTADEMASVLDPNEWEISATAPLRQAAPSEGQGSHLQDAVLRAVRRA